ncbi:tRNA (guanosine(46)-N7)-methyltransferase TrmB [Actinoplanes sp. NBRC 103695]|uniref:tRNA (guanosine(46)-N7)-methyltransferase TrmB n=1 Tax=Actinoplanes sp. NBRC 103695 TaxID=3032202 RepID=UPI002555C128|nr:tRNA (guanosine(46)-N7)-methyltransferase TrmB [Actinoplanes sp. NBRC 103695]
MDGAVERAVRTFHPRRGRMSGRHADALAELWPDFGVTVADGDRTPLDLGELFGRVAPRVLEIGFGMGDATAAMAAADRGRDYLAVEVHTPGIGNLLALVRELGLTNVRVAHGDAMELAHRIPEASLDAIHVFFPDPWPKARHHKRRLIQPRNVGLLRRLLRVGGVLHCATDWPEYADAMIAALDGDAGLARDTGRDTGTGRDSDAGPERNAGRDEQKTANGRPETKFERRGVLAGRPIADLLYRRV